MRMLILNLTRFGDLLQSQAVVHGLRQQGHEVGLVCLHNFAQAASLLDGVSYVAPLPGSVLLASLETHWGTALGQLHAWTEQIHVDFAPDAVLNLTSTIPARLLARLLTLSIPGQPVPQGFSLDEHGFGLSGSAWTAFFEASTRKRGCSPFNLIDTFLRASGLQGPARYALKPPGDRERLAAGERLRSLSASMGAYRGGTVSPPDGYIAFQLGASDARRQWPARFFADIGSRVFAAHNVMPVLVGTENERPLARAYLETNAPGIDLTGSTGLMELAAVLEHMRLLVTNDTGTMHLAAGLGIDCLAVFLATAQPWDTGPYREGCCSLEPNLACHPCGFDATCSHGHRCVEHITPQAVWPLVHGYLQTGTWQCPPETAALARVWQARRDAWGYMDLVSLSGHERDDRTLWIRLQRHIYRHLLDTLDGRFSTLTPGAVTAEPDGSGLSAASREAALTVLEQADALLHLLAEQGRLTMMQPTGRHGQLFLATCQRVGALFDAHDAFNVLGKLWHTLSQEKGAHLPDLLVFAAQLRASLAAWRALLHA